MKNFKKIIAFSFFVVSVNFIAAEDETKNVKKSEVIVANPETIATVEKTKEVIAKAETKLKFSEKVRNRYESLKDNTDSSYKEFKNYFLKEYNESKLKLSGKAFIALLAFYGGYNLIVDIKNKFIANNEVNDSEIDLFNN